MEKDFTITILGKGVDCIRAVSPMMALNKLLQRIYSKNAYKITPVANTSNYDAIVRHKYDKPFYYQIQLTNKPI